jgi:hypothetical protein
MEIIYNTCALILIVFILALFFTYKNKSLKKEPFYNREQTPIQLNCINLIKNPEYDMYLDTGIDKVISVNNNYLQIKKEITKGQFKKLLEDVYNSNKIDDTTKQIIDKLPKSELPRTILSFDLVTKWIGNLITEFYPKYKSDDDIYPNQVFLVETQRENINFYKNNDFLENYNFSFRVYRPNKNKNFIVSADVVLTNDNKKYINFLELISTDIEENVKDRFGAYKRNHLYNYDNRGIHCSLSNSKECQPTDRYKNAEEWLKTQDVTMVDDNNKSFTCLYKEAYNKEDCLSKDPIYGVGFWDKPCENDSECPFFGENGNLNYDNNRGKCIKETGKCELPINMKQIGFSSFDDSDNNKPFCHNCELYKPENCVGLECNKCCDIQKSKGINPDYAFENDLLDRNKPENKKKLSQNNLKVFDILL